MELKRSENAKKGVMAGIVNRVVATFFPFVIRTAMIHKMGVEYLGLNSLFTSILTVLSLSELGFSSAIIYSMYKPLAENDTDTINALLYFYRKVYTVIGMVITVIGVGLMPVLHLFIKDDVPQNINIYIIYLIFLCNTVIGYFFYGYLSSILNAYQRLDIISFVTSLSQTAGYICQLAAIIFISNYYLYILFFPLATLANNFLTAYAVRRMYPQYRCQGNVTVEQRQAIWKRVYGIMVEKICGTTRNSFDSICISAFIGLSATAVYNNYYYIILSLNTLFYTVCNAVQPGIGNSVVLYDKEKNLDDMRHMNFGYMVISGWAFISLICLYQPFMKLWVGGEYLLPVSSVLLFAVYFYVLRMGDIRSVYAQAKGLWWENRHLAITESVLNLVLNIVLARFFGINGVIAATIIALFGINFCMSSGVVYKYYFGLEKLKRYFLHHLMYIVVTAVVGGITVWLCMKIECEGLLLLIIRAMICGIIPGLLYVVAFAFMREARESAMWIWDRVMKKEGEK
ncbi:polysaccharide biosynthesis C-terminal domain-containing protein [Oribacterium sp. WCC10]|uniref:polysaccharide biosynthesis C-terminal domain-containing protein n=1 Tax=Oribacterium sp. WCC10 TaxID=1855343 RepID=UPI0008E86DE9|nr:polysaccharide biosynthesis C-terminal domain-containing protein [Oribacterium sp. WCC10]SFG36703.1 Membrane protein involved in the export of O-antigen and teichoic acid [Oribacterium sp. WCC10]